LVGGRGERKLRYDSGGGGFVGVGGFLKRGKGGREQSQNPGAEKKNA